MHAVHCFIFSNESIICYLFQQFFPLLCMILDTICFLSEVVYLQHGITINMGAGFYNLLWFFFINL